MLELGSLQSSRMAWALPSLGLLPVRVPKGKKLAKVHAGRAVGVGDIGEVFGSGNDGHNIDVLRCNTLKLKR